MYESTKVPSKVPRYFRTKVHDCTCTSGSTFVRLYVVLSVRTFEGTEVQYTYNVNNIVVGLRNLDADFSNNMWIVDYVYTCTVRSPLSPELA